MSRRRYMNTSEAAVDDNTLLLCHFEDFTDSSKYNRQLINQGASIVDNGHFGKCLDTNAGEVVIDNLSVGVYAGAVFTIDCWVYVTQNDTFVYTSVPYANYVFNIVIREDCAYVCRAGYDYYALVYKHYGVGWHHVAVTILNTTVKLYVDGILQGSYTGSRTSASKPNSMIGSRSVQGSLIDEFRISNVIRWESDFTPPVKPY